MPGIVLGDASTFPAVLIALLGAGLIGVGLTARYTLGRTKKDESSPDKKPKQQ